MPGPRPMPVKLKLLRGNPGRRPVRGAFEPPQPPLPPEPPAFLTGYARQEWNRIATSRHLFGLLREADVMVLAAYCESFKRWKTAVETLDQTRHPSSLSSDDRLKSTSAVRSGERR